MYHRFCQNPTLFKFLKMNRLVGSDKGCFDIAPYDTRTASDPSIRVMAVVVGPETQFNPRRIAWEILAEKWDERGTKYVPCCPSTLSLYVGTIYHPGHHR